jgi:hypothetical protein
LKEDLRQSILKPRTAPVLFLLAMLALLFDIPCSSPSSLTAVPASRFLSRLFPGLALKFFPLFEAVAKFFSS